MRRGNPSAPLLLLAAFVAGGVVAPAVHRAQHAAEAGAELAAHAAAGHHHHEVFGAHGVEWTPGCDRPVALDDIACILCKGVGGDLVAARAGATLPARPAEGLPAPTSPPLVRRAGPSVDRGPPHPIA